MLSELIAVIICVIIPFCLYQWHQKYQNQKRLKWLPTIPGWPFIGNILEFRELSSLLQNLSRVIPKTEKIVLLDVLGGLNIFTVDYDFVEFLLGHQDILSKSSDYRFFKKWLGAGLLLSDGSKWKLRRRIITPAFHFSILEQFIEVFESNGNILIDKLKKQIDQESIDIHQFITLFTLDVICETAMGVKVKAQENTNSQYVQNVKFMCRMGMIRSTSLIKRFDFLYPLTLDYYREKKALKQLHSFTNSVITTKRKEISRVDYNPESKEDEYGRKKKMAFLDIVLRTEINGKPLSQEDIREEVDTFMFEGHDTTASAISFCCYFLSEDPEVQMQAFKEQLEIFSDDFYRQATIKDLQSMKYLECIIKETLRLCPSIPLYGRYVNQDIKYKGNIIPKGINIFVFPYGMHRDSDYYSNPEKFDPSRFEDVISKKPYLFIPFSAGPRNCIGQKYAMLEMKNVISKLLRNFELLPAIPKHNLLLTAETVLKTANGVKIRLKTRKL